MKKKIFFKFEMREKKQKESNNGIEHNILSRIEKILKKFFVYLAFFFIFTNTVLHSQRSLTK